MRFHEITPGANFSQIQTEFKYYIAHNTGKRFMGYMWNDCFLCVYTGQVLEVPVS